MGRTLEFEAIGTWWHIEYLIPGQIAAAVLEKKIHARIDTFDRNYSRFRADSLVSEMSQQPGEYKLPQDAQPLLDWYRKLYLATAGAVTPLIGQVLADAGYDADYSLQAGTLVKPPRWEEVLGYTYPKLTLAEPALLDFGAAGKGYLADIIGELLVAEGASEFTINAGGDIVHRSKSGRTIRVGLEDPRDPSLAVGVATIGDSSICGSSGNRRSWGRYHHIINPASLESPRHIAALWVVAGTGLVADGLGTALFFVEPDELRLRLKQAGGPEFEYAIVYADGRLDASAGFPAEFFTGGGEGTVH